MNSKKIISGLLALTFVFGGAVLPNTAASKGAVISASAAEVFNYSDYEFTILADGTAEITNYKGSDAEIEVPSEVIGINGNAIKVTSIGQYALGRRSDIVKIVIPDGVTNIGDDAIVNCYGLEKIDIPNTVTNIGAGAFWGCKNLKNIVIPDVVTSIGNR